MYEGDDCSIDGNSDDDDNAFGDIDKIENCFTLTLKIFEIVCLMIMNICECHLKCYLSLCLQIIIPCKI